MGIFSIVIGCLLFLLCVAGGYIGGYALVISMINVDFKTIMEAIGLAQPWICYAIGISVGALLGLAYGLPLFMSGLTYRKVSKLAKRRGRKHRRTTDEEE